MSDGWPDPRRGSRRVFFVGLNTGYVVDGRPDDRCIEFFSRRCSRQLYCAIIGNVVIPGGHPSNDNTPRLDDSSSWAKLAEAIAKRGSVPGIQLATAWLGYQGVRAFRSSSTETEIAKARELVKDFSEKALDELFARLEEGTRLAYAAGYRHMQLHAAHGYLFSLLVDCRIYERASETLHRVGRWAELVKELGAESSIRISLRTGDDAFDAVSRREFQDEIASLPVDVIDVSSGFYNIDKRLVYPSLSWAISMRRSETLALALRQPSKRFIASGKMPSDAVEVLPLNVDIGLCRDLIANPDYLSEPERGCANHGKCHYYSRGAPHISCPRWADATQNPDRHNQLENVRHAAI